jgi:hypothetical protein
MIEGPGVEDDEWEPIPIPDTAPNPSMRHPTLGDSAGVWLYRDGGGHRVCFSVRYDTAGGGKTFRPRTWCKNRETGKKEWRWRNVPEPRPLYGVELLAQRPNAAVIVTEGEKACDAARRIFPDHIVTSPMNGAKSPHKADWKPLQGRHVIVWPDHDDVGEGFAAAIVGLLEGVAASILVIDVEKLIAIDGGKRPASRKVGGWDAADAETEWVDLGVLQAAALASIKHVDASGNRAWGARGLLIAPLPSVLPFDPEVLLPEAFRDFCVDNARRKVCPIDYVAVAVLVTLGAVIGAICVIRPKNHDDWIVASNLWGATVGDPGLNKKTVAMEAAMSLVSSLIDAEMRRFEEAKLNYAVAQKTHSAKLKAAEAELKAKAKAAAKAAAKDGGGDEGVDTAAEVLRQLEEKGPRPPVERRFTTNDPSVEKAGEIIRDNTPRGLLFVRDELTGIVAQWDREDHKGERAFYLEAHSGIGSFNTDRIGRGRIFVPVLNISIFGGYQPDMLAALLERVSNDLGNDGTIQRFQMLVFPDYVKWTWTNQSPDRFAYSRASEVFRRLANFNPLEWGAAKGDFDKFPWFTFDERAQQVFIRWSHDLHTKRLPNEDNPLIRQHLAKYDKLFPALALLFHLIDRSEERVGQFVSEVSALRAAEWCLYLESHARRCYALLGHNKLRHARLLARKIEHGELEDRFTARDVRQHNWAGLNDEGAVAGALEWLEIENWVRRGARESAGPAGGRPTVRYELHPELRREKP